MKTKLWGGGRTARGHVREDNQDVVVVEPALGLYAVLDGMGGANAGDVAAQLAGEQIADSLRTHARIPRRAPRQRLELALHTAACAVWEAAQARPECRGMGTTVVACLVVAPTHVVIGHAGDSRAYLLRGGDLVALTRDHTVAQNFVDAGVLSVEQMENSPHKHMLTRNLGRAYGVQPDVLDLALKPGDRLLLCSDGLYGGAPMEDIRRVLGSSDTPERIAENLVALALKGEALDNISAIVIAVDGGRARATTHPRSRGGSRGTASHHGSRPAGRRR